MKAEDFLSAPEDLLPAAISYGNHFQSNGYTVKIEPYDIAYPRTPFFLIKRRPTAIFVEVVSSLELQRVRAWVSYGKSCQKDTRILFAMREGAPVTHDIINDLKSMGVALWCIGSNGPYEILPAKDLALQIELPELPKGLRRLLGDAYDQFGRGEWRDGFESASQVFGREASAYLVKHAGTGRITPQFKNGSTVRSSRIPKLTIGQLAEIFGTLSSPNSADTRIGQALGRINEDRVTVAHYKGSVAAREKRLRANVASHMWVLVGGLCAIKGI